MNCVNNKCEKIGCRGRPECGILFECDESGYCRPEKCFENRECGLYAVCVQGACFPKPPSGIDPPTLCTKDEDCIFSSEEVGRCMKESNVCHYYVLT